MVFWIDQRKKSVVARWGSCGCQPAQQEGQASCLARLQRMGVGLRQYGWFDGAMFVGYLKEMRSKRGSVLFIANSANQHKRREARKHPEEHDGWRSRACPPRHRGLAQPSPSRRMQNTGLSLPGTDALGNLAHAVSGTFQDVSNRARQLQISPPLRMGRSFQ